MSRRSAEASATRPPADLPESDGPPEDALAGPPAGREWRDVAACFMIAALGLVVSGAPAPISVPVGLLAVLLVPGYALTIAVFPTDEYAGPLDRLALGLGLSFGTIAIMALVLDSVPGGLLLGSIRVAVTVWSMALLALAMLRRARARPDSARVGAADASVPTSQAARFTRAIVVASVLVTGVAYVVAVSDQPPRPTAFYTLGAGGKLADYPREATVGETIRLRVGVEQGTDRVGTYQLTLLRDGAVVATTGPVQVPVGERWSGEIPFVADRAGPDQELLLQLASPGDSKPLRTLRLWINVREAGAG